MTDINYSALLRELVNDYFDQRIDRVEYFTQRRDILDRIDLDFNGEQASAGWRDNEDNEYNKSADDKTNLEADTDSDADVTQPQDITRPNPLG